MKKAASDQLDEYSNSIKQRVTEAENIRAEAEKIYNYYASQHETFEEKIASMSQHMDETVSMICQDAERNLEAKIDIRRKMHKEKFALYEREEANRIKETILRKAMMLASLYMSDVATPSVTKQDVTNLLDVVKDKSITFH